MARSKPRRKSKKGLANNPIILVLILVVFAAVAANSLGFLDGLFGGGQTPAPPPKRPVSNTANANKSSNTAGGTEATGSAPEAASTDPATQESNEQGSSAEKTPDAKAAADPKKESKPKPQWDIPDFAFAVGRDNPFAEVAALKTAPTSSSNTASTPKNPTVPVKNPVSNPTPSKPTTSNPVSGSVKPVENEKPKEPWESWSFTGISEHGSLRFAIIETPENAYIVREGDRIEGTWLVEKITGSQVTLRSSTRSIVLVLGGEDK